MSATSEWLLEVLTDRPWAAVLLVTLVLAVRVRHLVDEIVRLTVVELRYVYLRHRGFSDDELKRWLRDQGL